MKVLVIDGVAVLNEIHKDKNIGTGKVRAIYTLYWLKLRKL